MEQLKNLTLAQFKKWALSLGKTYANKDLIIGLIGALGSGKTTFVKNFGQALGIGHIKSPTFIIHTVYKSTAGKNLHHLDLYRLHKPGELKPLGLDEMIRQKNRIILIEWVDKFPKLKKRCNIIVRFKIIGNKRHVFLQKN